MEDFYTIKESKTAEVIRQKSKFIATIFYVDSKNAANMIIKQVKKKYHDARHNCVAYRIIEKGTVIEKASDDGEPSGTAGSPILEVIRNYKLCNILVIVTRYFGGILLGTGGLVRAYTEATLEVIKISDMIKQTEGYQAEIQIEYKDIDNFKYYCKNNNIKIVNIQYLDYICCKIELENKIKNKFFKDIDTKNINIIHTKNICEIFVDKCVEK